MTLKAWVTGSRGFVGSALVKSLLKRGFGVTCISNSKPDQEGIFYVDYGNRESIRSILEEKEVPHVLFHLGWGGVYEPESSVHLGQNVSDTKTLLDELFQNGVEKAVLIGSSSEYGSRKGCLLENDTPIGRLTKYAQGKIEACRYGFEAASKHNKTFIHIRLFHVLGVADRQSSLINQLYKSYCDSTVLGLSACEQFRDYIYLSDAVEGMIRIGGVDSSEIVNLGSGGNIQLKELIRIFWDKLGAPADLLVFGAHKRPDYEPVQPSCYASLDKLEKLTNWKPNVTIEEGISRTVSELRLRGCS